MSATGTIRLTRFLSDPVLEQGIGQHLWAMRVVAQGTGNMPSSVFVFQQAGGGLDPQGGDRFMAVASAHEIEELPTQPPAEWGVDTIPFYRQSQLTVYLRTPEEVERVWGLLCTDVKELARNIYKATILKSVDVFVVDEQGHSHTHPIHGDNQSIFQLDYRPAGIAELEAGVQSILSPDSNKPGWLPVDGSAPAGMKYRYNLDQHPELQQLFPLDASKLSSTILTFNGVPLTINQTFAVTENGIFWAGFTDALVELPTDGPFLNQQPDFLNAPWPSSYIDDSAPGQVTPQLEIILSA